VHRDSYVEVAKSYYAAPPEYIGQQVWVRWDQREVRIFNGRWEQIQVHRRLEPGQYSHVLGIGGGHGTSSQSRLLAPPRFGVGQRLCQVGPGFSGATRHRSPALAHGPGGIERQASFRSLNAACALAPWATTPGACATCVPSSIPAKFKPS
jgi:hypothetical protein